MPNTPELRAEVAGVVAVVDTSREGETVRHAVWHVAIAPDDAGPRLRGAWVVGDESAGIGIRETSGLITDDGAAFIPHRITPKGTTAS